MNDQIKLLAEQANLYVNLNGKLWPRNMSAEESEVAYKKFAELIVRECVDIIHQQERIPKEFLYAKSAATHELAIKEHFGVQ